MSRPVTPRRRATLWLTRRQRQASQRQRVWRETRTLLRHGLRRVRRQAKGRPAPGMGAAGGQLAWPKTSGDLAEPRLEMPNAAAATVSSSLRKQRWLPLPSPALSPILDRLQKLPQPLQTWLHWLQPQLQGWWQTPRCSPASTACAALQQSCLPPSLNCLLPLAQKSSELRPRRHLSRPGSHV